MTAGETMPAGLTDALRQALTRGTGDALAEHYAADAVLESYVHGVRDTAYGAASVASSWSRLVGAGDVTSWTVTTESGGVEVDAELDTGGDGRLRQLHRLHLDGSGAVRWHVVFPARPVEPPTFEVPTGLGIAAGTIEPLPHGGFSGATLCRATTTGGEAVVVKHIRRSDWMPRATRDPGREALLLLDGVYGKLPAGIDSPVTAAAPVHDGWVVVMRDVTEAHRAVMDGTAGDALPELLSAMHEMHETFAGTLPSESLCRLPDRLALFGPGRPLLERHGCDLLPKTLTTMWDTFAERVEPDLVDAVLRVVADPSRLLAELAAAAPMTLLHGDYQPTNLGVESGGVVALDWGLAAYGPAEVDYVWFLSNAAWGGDDEREHVETLWTELTGTRRDSRAADLAVVFHAAMGELAFLVTEPVYALDGAFVPSPETVAWWTARVRAAFERVGDLA